MALSILPMVYSPGEVAPAGFLCIVFKGCALYGGKVLTSGRLWGEDMLLEDPSLHTYAAARLEPANQRLLYFSHRARVGALDDWQSRAAQRGEGQSLDQREAQTNRPAAWPAPNPPRTRLSPCTHAGAGAGWRAR